MGVGVIEDPDQNSTDFGKAVHHIQSKHPGIDIVAMGGLGGRVDQGLSQLHHLLLFQSDPDYAHGRLYLVSRENITFVLKRGGHRIRVREGTEEVFGKYIGILPLLGPAVLTTSGLEWDLKEWTSRFGERVSTSNHVLPETKVVDVMTSTDVLFTIAFREKDLGALNKNSR